MAVWVNGEARSDGGFPPFDFDIHISTSTDNGGTWTPPSSLRANDSLFTIWDFQPNITTDGNGTWMIVWSSLGFDIFTATSTDNGVTWTDPIIPNSNSQTEFLILEEQKPNITTDGKGTWVVTWEVSRRVNTAILVAKSENNGLTWTDPILLNPNGIFGEFGNEGESIKPQIATDGQGNWAIVWSFIEDRRLSADTDWDIFMVRSSDDGTTWTPPTMLNTNGKNDTGMDMFPQISTDGAGNWITVWQSTENLVGTAGIDSDIFIATSIDHGATWTVPALLNTNGISDTLSDIFPKISPDGSGNFVAIWSIGQSFLGGGEANVSVSTSNDNGTTWSAPVLLNTANNFLSGSSFLDFVTDGLNHWVTVWSAVDPNDPNMNETDIFLINSIITVSPQAPDLLNSNGLSDVRIDEHAQIATDSAGNWVAVWDSRDISGGLDDKEVFVARSSNNGMTWSNSAVLNTNDVKNTIWDFFPDISTDSAGNWIAIWQSAGGIYVARSTNNGATWTDSELLSISGSSVFNTRPQIANDSAGNWVVVWSSPDSGNSSGSDDDIFVSRSSDDGMTWSARALLNINGTFDSGRDRVPHISTDGTGNWVAVWESDENMSGTAGFDFDIFAARSTDNGETWTAPELLNTNGTANSGDDHAPQVVTDRLGNWITVWDSNEDLNGSAGTDVDIFIAHSTDNGITWSAPALLNANGTFDSQEDVTPQISPNSNGDWVAVWSSRENLNGIAELDRDIFRAHSTNNGISWSFPVMVNRNGFGDFGDDRFPQITTDSTGNWVVVWDSNDNLGTEAGLDRDIYSDTFRLGFTPTLSAAAPYALLALTLFLTLAATCFIRKRKSINEQ